MGAGPSVGQISVKVTPDMDGFREKIRLELEAIERERHEIHFTGEFDSGKLVTEVKEAAEEARSDVKVGVDLDAKGLRTKVKAAAEEAGVGQKVKIKVEADTFSLDKVKKDIDRFLTNESLDIGRAQQRLGQTMRNWSPQGQAATRLGEMEQEIHLHPHLDEAGIEEIRLRLDHENFKAKVKLEIDKQNLKRMEMSAERDLERIFDKHLGAGGHAGRGGFLGGLMNMGSSAGNAASGFKMPDLIPNIGGLGATGTIAIVVAGLSLLAPALALVSQAIVGLPALVGGLALPIGVFALGLGGIKKALDDSGIMTETKGKKGKEKQGLGAELKELQKSVSDVFEKGFTPLFRQVAGVIPTLTRGLPFVAKGIVDLATGLTNAITSPAFVGGFDRFTNSVSTMLTNLSPGLQSFTTGMSNLITNVGDHLPGLGNTMSAWADRFTNWVTEISKPKKDWFGKDVGGSSELDSAVSNMKPILDSVVDFVGKLTAAGLKLAADPNMIKGITDFVNGLTNLALQIATMGPVFENLASLFGKIKPPDSKTDLAPGAVPAPGARAGSPLPPAPVDHPDHSLGGNRNWVAPIWEIPKKTPPGFPHFAGLPYGQAPAYAGKSSPHVGIGPDHSALQLITKKLADLFAPHPKEGAPIGTKEHPMVVEAGAEPFDPGKPMPEIHAPNGAWDRLKLQGGRDTSTATPWNIPQGFMHPGGADGGAGAGTPQKIAAPKIELPKIPPGSDKLWEPLISATHTAGSQINGEVSTWQGQIKSALDAAASGAKGSGQAIGTQFAAGITAGEGAAVNAAHHLADAVKAALPHSPAKTGPFSGGGWNQVKTSGEAVANQFGDGIDEGTGSVAERAAKLAEAVQSKLESGMPLSGGIQKQIKDMQAEIQIAEDQLHVQEDALPGKDNKGARQGLKDQIAELKSAHDKLKLGADEGKPPGKGGKGDSMQEAAQMITTGLASMLDAGKNFAMANVNQFESDVGISGNGAVETIANTGISWMQQMLGKGISGAFGAGGKGGDTNNFYGHDAKDVLKQKEVHERTQALQSGPR
jgi:hypothetical protein